MRVLLDECLPRGLAKEVKGHQISTVPDEGWAGTKNGALLDLIQEKFDVFITVDRNLAFQQNLENLRIGVIILSAPSNRLVDLLPLVPKIRKVLSEINKGDVVRVSTDSS